MAEDLCALHTLPTTIIPRVEARLPQVSQNQHGLIVGASISTSSGEGSIAATYWYAERYVIRLTSAVGDPGSALGSLALAVSDG